MSGVLVNVTNLPLKYYLFIVLCFFLASCNYTAEEVLEETPLLNLPVTFEDKYLSDFIPMEEDRIDSVFAVKYLQREAGTGADKDFTISSRPFKYYRIGKLNISDTMTAFFYYKTDEYGYEKYVNLAVFGSADRVLFNSSIAMRMELDSERNLIRSMVDAGKEVSLLFNFYEKSEATGEDSVVMMKSGTIHLKPGVIPQLRFD